MDIISSFVPKPSPFSIISGLVGGGGGVGIGLLAGLGVGPVAGLGLAGLVGTPIIGKCIYDRACNTQDSSDDSDSPEFDLSIL